MLVRAICVSDTHAELPRVGPTAYAIFDQIGEAMKTYDAKFLIHGGDWLHQRGKLHTLVFNKLYNKVKQHCEQHGPIYTVAGNHDLAVSEGGVEESALWVFSEEIENFYVGDAQEPLQVTLYEGETHPVVLYLIGYSAAVNLEELVKSIEVDPKAINIAVLHQVTMCSESSVGYVFGEGVDAELLSNKFTFSILGDVHKPQMVLDNILVPGAPYAMDFGDTGDRGCWLLTIDTVAGTVTPKFVPLESPKFITVEFDTAEGFEEALAAIEPDNFYRFKYPESLSSVVMAKPLPDKVFPVPEPSEVAESRVDLTKPQADVVAEYVTYACANEEVLNQAELVELGHRLLEEASK